MSDKSDILVLGATGFTGNLIIRYLLAHPQRSQFSLALGARSPKKLEALVEKLNLSEPSVKLVQIDVTDEVDVERAVRSARVVINTIGPYWLWGTPVVRSCVRNGVHYVDLTGETHWTKKIILECDYFATKTGAIIVPSCGFDSIPSDAAAYLANKTLKSIGPLPNLDMNTSTSAFEFRGGISGGTISTIMTAFETVPDNVRLDARRPYTTSPFIGAPPPPFRFLYNLPIPGIKPLIGAFFIMGPGNTALVQRSYGLFELHAKTASDPVTRNEALLECYGSNFKYTEFLAMSSIASVGLYTVALIFGLSMLFVSPIRYLIKKILPQSGEGPSEETMRKGFFNVTNITTASSPPVQVKTVIKGRGDPGYLLTSVMISESALCFLLPLVSESKNVIHDKPKDNLHALPPLARKGGILTPMTAFGNVLLQRLEETGRFEFSSSIIDDDITHGKKRS